MSFKLSKVTGEPRFDALPVAKVTNYPLEQRDYRPYAQNCICMADGELVLRMWAFEVSPMPGSEVRGVFYLFPGRPELALHAWAQVRPEPEGTSFGVAVVENGDKTLETLTSFTARPFAGEDLQGVYWGGLIHIPLTSLEKWGEMRTEVGDVIPGNFYKTCDDKKFRHYGSYHPAAFPDAPYGTDSMADFQIVAY